MSQMHSDPIHNPEDDLLAEYHLDYQQAKPNRFATRDATRKITGFGLDPDAVRFFTTLIPISIPKANLRTSKHSKYNQR